MTENNRRIIKLKEILKKKKIVGTVPVNIKFQRSDGEYTIFKAKKGEEVIRWKDFLKALRQI
jgi:hypothetical protein